MPLFAVNEDRIFGDILYDIVNNTNLRRASPGSKTRAIAAALSKQLGKMYKKFDVNVAQAFVDGAQGRYLEFIGDLLAVPRLGMAAAAVASGDKNVKFYVDTGTFGNINNNNSITIPAGTIVSTGPSNTGIIYTVPYSVVLSSSISQMYIGVQAVKAGSNQNVGRGQLIYHSFTSYTDVLNGTLKVTNEAEIMLGQDIEPEENYRYRIANKVLSSEAANRTAIRLAALAVPGVADIVVIPYFRGIGSGEILVKSVTPSVPAGLIAAVQDAVDNVKSDGIRINTRGPNELGLSLTGTLIFRKRLTDSEKSGIIAACTSNITDYIDGLDIGEEFVVNEAIERVMATSAEIKDMGVTGKPFDSMYVYKKSRLEDNKIRSTLITNYAPEVDERLIVENKYAGSTPILFRTNG